MKEKLLTFFQDSIIPKLDAFANNTIVKSIQSGMSAPMSAMIVGSVFSILKTPPVTADMTNGFMLGWQAWAQANASWLNICYTFTMDSIAIFTVIGLVIALTRIKKIPPTNLVILSLMSFFIICSGLVVGEDGTAGIASKYFTSSGIFSAVIISIAVVYLGNFLKTKGLRIKLPASVPANVAEPIEGLAVNFVIIAGSIAIRLGLASVNQSLPTLINMVFAPLLSTSDSLGAVIIYILILRGLWFFGVHGGNVVGSIMQPILIANMAENIQAYANHQPMPYIFTNSFAQALLNVGMIPLVVAMFIVCKSAQLKAISKVGLVPALFSIGEPITFGVPIVFNFKLLIPYLGSFLFCGIGFYLATAWGWMNRTMVNVPFTMPGPIKAFLATMDWRAALIWFLLMAIAVLMYIPFLRSYDRDLLKAEQANVQGE